MQTKISLDVIIPTHNRVASGLLQRTLTSLLALRPVPEMDIKIYLIANACNDSTKEIVEDYQKKSSIPIIFSEEPTIGKSFALNRGIKLGHGDWIAFFDDDEIICANWPLEFAKKVKDIEFDFCAGRYIADFEIPPPEWLPQSTNSIIACHNDETIEQQFKPKEAFYFWGGNCVIKRAVINSVGDFDTSLGRSGARKALGCEDSEMQQRLLKAHFQGWYFPTLCILHWVPKERLTKTYFRSWKFWKGYCDRQFYYLKEFHQTKNIHWLGIPRWYYKELIKAMADHFINCITFKASKNRLDTELTLRWYLGYFLARFDEIFSKQHKR